MAIIGQDSFSRADQSGWGTASDGQTYTQPVGTLVLSIVSNQGNVAGGSGATVIFFGSKTSADAQALCRMKFSATSNSLSLVLRATASNNFYLARYGNAAGQIDISKDVAGTITQIVTGSFAPAISTLFWCRFQVVGNTLSAKWWLDGSGEPSTWTLSTTDSAISAAGQFGFRVAGTAGNNMDFDSYTVTDTLPLVIPRYIPRALGGTIIPDRINPPLAYVPRALGSTILIDDRAFIPRALGGTYIPDTSLWVPRALGSTIQVAPLTATFAGVGTLAETFTLATSLSDTLAGVGTLAPTLSANMTLPAVSLDGVGTLTGPLTLTTSLSTTLVGVGTLNGTATLTTALATTFVGVGTLVGTLSTTGGVSLAVTLAGVGTLTGALSANTALTDTLVGVGTLAGTILLSTALTRTLPGVGTLSGVASLRIALSLTFAGMGMLIPTLSVLGHPSHAQILLQASRGIILLQAPRGTITLQAPRGKITLSGE
jgi:hypothetical protein